jgi:hypothetical protein
VEFTPELVSAYWDKGIFAMDISSWLSDRKRDHLASTEPSEKNTPSLFHPLRGSLGLLCEKGSAVFRGLTIEPLSDDQ